MGDCGHRWVAASKEAPDKCGKCRRRGWHKTLTTAELVRQSGAGLDERIREVAREVFEEMMAGLPVEDIEPEYVERSANVTANVSLVTPDASLYDRKAVALAALASVGQPKVIEVPFASVIVAPTLSELCGYEEQDRDTGEWGRCRRPLGHKGVCGQWQPFSKVE